MRWKGLSLTRDRVVGAAAILALLLLGALLPYLTLQYINDTSEVVVGRERLIGASNLVGSLDPTYLPGYTRDVRQALTLALNTLSFGIGLQQIGSVVAAATVVGQLFDEINKFLWWPLHLASYLLILIPIPVFIGMSQLHAQRIEAHLGVAWLPAVLAGVLSLVITFRSHQRIDSYGGI